MPKKLFAIVLSLVLFFPLLSPLNTKADDITGITLEKELRAMVQAGVINGYGNGKYAPDKKVTRGEFASFLSRALKLPNGPSVFKDVSPASSLAYGINAAAAAKIVQGKTKDTFVPEQTITRKDMALMISRALNYLNIKVEAKNAGFTDTKWLTSDHQQAINRSVSLNIIKGYNDGSFRPDEQATRAQSAAFIYRLLKASGEIIEDNTPPVPPGNSQPQKPKPYQVGNVDASGKITYSAVSFDTFPAAKQAMSNQNQEVVTYNKEIIYMKQNSGVVFVKPATGKSTAQLYSDSAFKTAVTYAQPTAELKYVTSNDRYIIVSIGGKSYYMKHEDGYIVPFEGAPGRSFYQVVNGELEHKLYVPAAKPYYVSYKAGPAPDFLAAGQKYYSWDNATFYNESGRAVGKAHQYFQFLSMRTQTSYTASQLDSYIKKVLAERQSLNQAKYKDATKRSKLLGLGATLKKVEKEKRLNALMVLAMAIHESDYGMSSHALNNNNLFGIAVYDSNPSEGKSFPSPAHSVQYLADGYMNDRYVIPNPGSAWKQSVANGAAPGNKGVGINMKYASDIQWGAKVAGHAYKIDKALGRKDFARYSLALTNTKDLNVRSLANNTVLYQYRKAGMPVAILGSVTSGGTAWKKIISDALAYREGYIAARYVTPLSIAK
ncbi:S-layer homology domain-containing protein [Bacillus xiapuensis]|uniref:S-layer homology domain-containing protein n=1 Tax=Bacillus xiapuensis TaxID=2014075 RepID=UPI000C2504B0|nr:S-layer homology domain-containing protein [Bacillus xiapuensis]